MHSKQTEHRNLSSTEKSLQLHVLNDLALPTANKNSWTYIFIKAVKSGKQLLSFLYCSLHSLYSHHLNHQRSFFTEYFYRDYRTGETTSSSHSVDKFRWIIIFQLFQCFLTKQNHIYVNETYQQLMKLRNILNFNKSAKLADIMRSPMI